MSPPPTLQRWRAGWARMRRHPEFRRGAVEMSGISLGVAAWGLVTGVAMIKSGLSLPVALAMSLLVFAGSAQLTALPLIVSGAPVWVVWATAICVNLRFVIQSAMWRPYLAHLPLRKRALMSYVAADLNYVLFMKRFPVPKPAPGQVEYFWGGSLMNYGAWHGMSLIGILFASAIPTEWGFGFAGVLALTGLACSMLIDRTTWVAAGVAGCAAVAAFALPYKLHIVVAIAAAVAIGMLVDHTTPKDAVAGDGPDMRTLALAGGTDMTTTEALITIVGLALISLLTRGFFVLPSRELPMPAWLQRGLRYAPVAALVAVVVPEVLMTDGRLLTTWQDARLYAAATGIAWYFWRRSILGTIVTGTGVMLLRLGLGW